MVVVMVSLVPSIRLCSEYCLEVGKWRSRRPLTGCYISKVRPQTDHVAFILLYGRAVDNPLSIQYSPFCPLGPPKWCVLLWLDWRLDLVWLVLLTK